MKNHKGVVATLLTLGLVLVGTLVTLGISYLTNTNKIASNPRAAEDSCDLPDDSCWIVKCINGKPGSLQYSPSLCQYDIPTSSCSGGSPYSGGGQMVIGVSARDDLLDPPTFSCTGSGNAGSGNEEQEGGDNITPGAGGGTAKCPKKDYNCTEIDAKYQSHVLSKDKDGLYHDGDSCKGTGKTKTKIAVDVCVALNDNECFSYNCEDIGSHGWKSKELLAMGDGEERQYYTELKKNCTSTAYTEATIESTCNPAAAPTCDPITCSEIVTDLDPKYADKEIYQWSNASGTYYKDNKCSDNKKISDINKECPQVEPTKPPNAYDSVTNNGDPRNYVCGLIEKKFYKGMFSDKSSDLPDFVKSCQQKATEQNTCFQVIISDIGTDIVADYMHCCAKSCP